MAYVTLGELRQHVPGVNESGAVVRCSCGWRLEGETGDYWLSFLEHIPNFASDGRLALSLADRRFLNACHIKI